MLKTCKQIGEEIQKLKRNMQQSRMHKHYVKISENSEINDDAVPLENKKKNSNTSRDTIRTD
jgi:hypothetical protein